MSAPGCFPKAVLRRLAHEAGFDGVGVAPATRAPHAAAFRAWLEEGNHAGMVWLERDPGARCDPRETLEGARSVIALAMNYHHPDPPSCPDGSAARGLIARYARGRDYHNLIRKRLRLLDRALCEAGGRQKLFVDSGPLLERDFAALAGLAWQGKNTLALTPRLGTWFFLAAVTTTLEVEPDPPARDHCGKCVRCIAACPTGAIDEPYKLDARRCISYWTIEHRGTIPEALRPLIGRRIFGCDDCLEACPWNRFARTSREADFRARPVSGRPLRDFLGLDEAGFLRLFEGSPIRRAGYHGFLRNVCVALGNCGGPGDLPALRQCAGKAGPLPAEHARWAVRRLTA